MLQSYLCPYCGARVERGARYCSDCGTELNWPPDRPQPAAQNYCHRCGVQVSLDSYICQNCGMELARSSRPGIQSDSSVQDNVSHDEYDQTAKFFKIAGVTIIGTLLFVSLFIFGLAFTVNQTALNPNFVTSEVNRLELAPVANYLVAQNITGSLLNLSGIDLSNTITKLEPSLTPKIDASINSVYDYLLSKRENLDLAAILRSNLLSTDFVAAVIDDIDVTTLIKPLVHDQVSQWVPSEVGFLIPYVNTSVDQTLASEEPTIKELLNNAAAPIADYLSGQKNEFSISIPTQPFIDGLKATLLKDIGESTIPELAQLPTGTVEAVFNQVFDSLSFPASIEINQNMIGADISGNVKTALSQAENSLTQFRTGISNFQFWYIVLIVLIILLCASVFLIYREIKGATRMLGSIFLAYAIVELIFFLLISNIVDAQLGKLLASTPVQLKQWVGQTMNDFLYPLQMLSIGFLIAGAVLIAVSFVFRPRNAVISS